MMSFSRSFKGIWVSCRPTIINTVNDLLFRSGIKLSSTDVRAVQRLKFRPQKRHRIQFDVIGYALVIIPVSAFGLGTWQVFRKFEKEKIIEEFKKKISQPPVELPKDLKELENMEFRAIKVRGKFDHSKELYLGPRPQLSDGSFSQSSTLMSRSKGGFLVITPFKLSDRNLTILVNRGWVPAKKKSPLARKEGQIAEEVELIGLVRLHEKREPLGLRNMPEKGYWVYRDLYTMAEIVGTAPVLLDADKASTIVDGPIGGQTIVDIRNVHLSYIYTWYALAILSSWFWYKRYLQRKPFGMTYVSKPYEN